MACFVRTLVAPLFFALAGILYSNAVESRADELPKTEFPLWSTAAPGALGSAATDIPTLTPYWADKSKASGAAMIVCPGGGYNHLAPHEGEPFARWLNSLGIHALVLKYRLVKNGYHLPEILPDAARAVRVVRSNAASWQIDPKRIGILGSSAGGHLSATLATQCDAGESDAADPAERVSSRPDLVVLCYAFILFDRKDAKNDRQTRFLGEKFTDDDVRRFSPALNVTSQTPPCFIWQTVEDASVVSENAMVFADALRVAGVPFELHLYQKGRHGIGLGLTKQNTTRLHPWTTDCANWLEVQGFVAPAGGS